MKILYVGENQGLITDVAGLVGREHDVRTRVQAYTQSEMNYLMAAVFFGHRNVISGRLGRAATKNKLPIVQIMPELSVPNMSLDAVRHYGSTDPEAIAGMIDTFLTDKRSFFATREARIFEPSLWAGIDLVAQTGHCVDSKVLAEELVELGLVYVRTKGDVPRSHPRHLNYLPERRLFVDASAIIKGDFWGKEAIATFLVDDVPFDSYGRFVVPDARVQAEVDGHYAAHVSEHDTGLDTFAHLQALGYSPSPITMQDGTVRVIGYNVETGFYVDAEKGVRVFTSDDVPAQYKMLDGVELKK